MMNGEMVKKAAINKVKSVASAASTNGQKKRRKGGDLKPIITNDGPSTKAQRYVISSPHQTPLFAISDCHEGNLISMI